MKMKRANSRSEFLGQSPRDWIRRVFRKKPVTIISWRRKRRAKALARASRRAYLGLALGAAVGVALFAILLSVPPQMSPEDIAASVRAQSVHKKAAEFPAGSRLRVPDDSPQLQPVAPQTAATRIPDAAASATRRPEEYLPVSFQKLSSFRFFVIDQMVDKASDSADASKNGLAQIPDEVRALNDKPVSVSGFMLPMKYEGKLTTEFLLLRNQSLCCYGMPPKITEWVNVRTAGKGVKPIMDVPVTVFGVFHVGDVRENGQLVGIYSLDAQGVGGP